MENLAHVVVDEPGLPLVRIERRGDVTHPHAPIGTRDRRALHAVVDDRALTLRPGPGRLARRSYRVGAGLGGRVWLLTPCSPFESRFLRGGRHLPSRSLGRLGTDEEGVVEAWWRADDDPRVPRPEPDEVAIALALGRAFGTGAHLALAALLSGLDGDPIS